VRRDLTVVLRSRAVMLPIVIVPLVLFFAFIAIMFGVFARSPQMRGVREELQKRAQVPVTPQPEPIETA
jgi:hypothetical protein